MHYLFQLCFKLFIFAVFLLLFHENALMTAIQQGNDEIVKILLTNENIDINLIVILNDNFMEFFLKLLFMAFILMLFNIPLYFLQLNMIKLILLNFYYQTIILM